MPFPMKIQPIDFKGSVPGDLVLKPPPAKSRLKRLLERQFPGVLRISSAERIAGVNSDGGKDQREREGGGDLEPSSVCLDRMVQNFIEESNEKPSKCGRSRCNCFNGNCDDSSDDERDFFTLAAGDGPMSTAGFGEASEILKSLVPCASTAERNLLADTSKILENVKNNGIGGKGGGGKGDTRQIVTDGLLALGYDASICKSRWEKSFSFPAGEYEYVDVIVKEGERLLIDIDFRSEFEIARSTKSYRAVLQSLPSIFVGKGDRLHQIVLVASEAAKQSLKKKGLHFPPWRKPEYMKAKWLSPYQRAGPTTIESKEREEENEKSGDNVCASISAVNFATGLDLRSKGSGEQAAEITGGEEEKDRPQWQPPAIKPRTPSQRGAKVVTGLSSLVPENP